MYLWIIVGLAVILGYVFSVRGSGATNAGYHPQVSGDPMPEQNYISLRTENGTDVVSRDGLDYFATEGTYSEELQTWIWDWHGRMGEPLGYLIREGSVFPDGGLYTLRGRDDLLLAYLPGEGWPITDMRIFLPSGVALPSVKESRFSFAEVYRLSGEFSEEEQTKIADIEDPSVISSLASLWFEGDLFDPPEGEYDRFRVYLYSAEIPGLYATVNLHLHSSASFCVMEKYGFSGDTLLPQPLTSSLQLL